MSLRDALHWRYAAKRMSGEKVSDENIESILTAAQYAPTSMGLQPFTLFLITNTTIVNKIKPIAYNQAQIGEASHLLLFASFTQLHENQIDEYLQNIVAIRGVSMESLVPFRNSMMRFVSINTDQEIQKWAANQVYLSLGFAIAEAALLGVDATPMEGFDANALDELLSLQSHNLTSTALLAIGYRDAEKDFLANQKKVRRPLDQLLVRIE